MYSRATCCSTARFWGRLRQANIKNMSRVPCQIALLSLTVSLLMGCQTNAPRSSPEEADIIHYAGKAPVWIFIPFPTLTDEGRGHPARIALPPRRDWTTNRIEIVVQGEVMVEGIV